MDEQGRQLRGRTEDRPRGLVSNRLAFFFGIALAALGIIALIVSLIGAVATSVLLASIVIASGLVEIAHGIVQKFAGPSLLSFLGGLFSVAVGALILFSLPLVGGEDTPLPALFALYFLVNGVFRGINALMTPAPRATPGEWLGDHPLRAVNWGWDLFYAGMVVAFGVIIMVRPQGTSITLLGVLLGIEILVKGVSLALVARKLTRSTLQRRVVA